MPAGQPQSHAHRRRPGATRSGRLPAVAALAAGHCAVGVASAAAARGHPGRACGVPAARGRPQVGRHRRQLALEQRGHGRVHARRAGQHHGRRNRGGDWRGADMGCGTQSTINYAIGTGSANPIHLNALSSPCGWSTCMSAGGVIGCGGPGGSGTNTWRGETYVTITNGEVWLRAYCTRNFCRRGRQRNRCWRTSWGIRWDWGIGPGGFGARHVWQGTRAWRRCVPRPARTTLGADDADAGALDLRRRRQIFVRWRRPDADGDEGGGGPRDRHQRPRRDLLRHRVFLHLRQLHRAERS